MSADPAEAEGAEGSNAAPAPSKPAPTKVAYHPNVRCLRGGGGVGPVIVGRMYRALYGLKGYVSEEKATEEEKAKGPVEPREGYDLRGWAAADIQGLRGADGKLDLEVATVRCEPRWGGAARGQPPWGAAARGQPLKREA